MKRLVLIHGRGQGRRTQNEIFQVWTDALRRGGALRDAQSFKLVDIRLPLYGGVLDQLARQPVPGRMVAKGSGAPADDFAECFFQRRFVLEMFERAGLSETDIQNADQYVEKGPQNWAWVRAAARVLSEKMPWLGDQLLPFIRDVHAYLTRDHARQKINDIVAEHLDEEAVVVGHSLGSIVAYCVLREQTATTPLLVTVGSPLGIKVVKSYLPRPLGHPQGVQRWLNAADPRDPVALHPHLDRDTFPARIENITVNNPTENPHGITGYLSHKGVADEISRALGLS